MHSNHLAIVVQAGIHLDQYGRSVMTGPMTLCLRPRHNRLLATVWADEYRTVLDLP
jgi:hypothetical protein